MNQTSPAFDSSFRLLSRDHLDTVLNSLENVSDFYFCDGEPIRATVRGKTVTVSRRPLDAGDIKNLVVILGDESMGLFQNLMTEAKPRDRSYVTQDTRIRHRVNLTINSAKTSKAVRVVMRRLESEPWPKEKLRIPDGLLEAAVSHEPGLVMILGATGSGKTSLLSGVLRHIVENDQAHGHIVTIEDPVEYTYDKVACENFVVSQIEVGVGCQNFADGLRAAMRMHPTHILVGEIRDPETAAAAIAAARSGHKVFATMHVSSVAEMFGRWSDFFPPGAELRAMNDLAAVIDFACYQTLEDTEKGFMPVQESLSLMNVSRTDFITMVAANLENLFKVMEGYVQRYGIPHDVDRQRCNPSQTLQLEKAAKELQAEKNPLSHNSVNDTEIDIPSSVLHKKQNNTTAHSSEASATTVSSAPSDEGELGSNATVEVPFIEQVDINGQPQETSSEEDQWVTVPVIEQAPASFEEEQSAVWEDDGTEEEEAPIEAIEQAEDGLATKHAGKSLFEQHLDRKAQRTLTARELLGGDRERFE